MIIKIEIKDNLIEELETNGANNGGMDINTYIEWLVTLAALEGKNRRNEEYLLTLKK